MSLKGPNDPKAKNHMVSRNLIDLLAAVWITGHDQLGWASTLALLEWLFSLGKGSRLNCQQEGPDSWGSHILAVVWLRTARACFHKLRA